MNEMMKMKQMVDSKCKIGSVVTIGFLSKEIVSKALFLLKKLVDKKSVIDGHGDIGPEKYDIVKSMINEQIKWYGKIIL